MLAQFYPCSIRESLYKLGYVLYCVGKLIYLLGERLQINAKC